MAKVTIHGWQTDVSNAAQPTGTVTLRKASRFAASDEEQRAFAHKHPGEIVICLTVPPASKNDDR
jgi:hypothetical protein